MLSLVVPFLTHQQADLKCIDVWYFNHLVLQLLVDNAPINFHISSSIMLYWILSAILIVDRLSQNNLIGFSGQKPKSPVSIFKHNNSKMPFTIARYPALALDGDTTVCFFLFQVTNYLLQIYDTPMLLFYLFFQLILNSHAQKDLMSHAF